jgi:hypothetical protein
MSTCTKLELTWIGKENRPKLGAGRTLHGEEDSEGSSVALRVGP